MSFYAIPQFACKVAVGLVGATALVTSANTVAVLAEAVRRAVCQGFTWIPGLKQETQPANVKVKDEEWNLRAFTPYKTTKDLASLGMAGLLNGVVAAGTLFIANRYCPSLVTSACSLLQCRFNPIQP